MTGGNGIKGVDDRGFRAGYFPSNVSVADCSGYPIAGKLEDSTIVYDDIGGIVLALCSGPIAAEATSTGAIQDKVVTIIPADAADDECAGEFSIGACIEDTRIGIVKKFNTIYIDIT